MTFKLTDRLISLSLLLVGLVVSISDSYGQSSDCTKFKEGSFKIVDSGSGTSYINRKGPRQAELMEGNKDSSIFIVKWIEDCVYTLKPTKETIRRQPLLPENAMMTIEIIEVRDSSYLQISTSNFSEMRLTNEVVKIK